VARRLRRGRRSYEAAAIYALTLITRDIDQRAWLLLIFELLFFLTRIIHEHWFVGVRCG